MGEGMRDLNGVLGRTAQVGSLLSQGVSSALGVQLTAL